jgi:hypothetical protein
MSQMVGVFGAQMAMPVQRNGIMNDFLWLMYLAMDLWIIIAVPLPLPAGDGVAFLGQSEYME